MKSNYVDDCLLADIGRYNYVIEQCYNYLITWQMGKRDYVIGIMKNSIKKRDKLIKLLSVANN